MRQGIFAALTLALLGAGGCHWNHMHGGGGCGHGCGSGGGHGACGHDGCGAGGCQTPTHGCQQCGGHGCSACGHGHGHGRKHDPILGALLEGHKGDCAHGNSGQGNCGQGNCGHAGHGGHENLSGWMQHDHGPPTRSGVFATHHQPYSPTMPQDSYQPAPGPSAGAVAYPYYTLRGPRDFLSNNPGAMGR